MLWKPYKQAASQVAERLSTLEIRKLESFRNISKLEGTAVQRQGYSKYGNSVSASLKFEKLDNDTFAPFLKTSPNI